MTKPPLFNLASSPRAISIGIFLLAFSLRLIFAVQWHNLPYGDAPLWDAKAYEDWATHILNGHFLQDTAFYSSPLYPYFLALIYKLFGHHLWIASLVNALIDSLTCVCLSLISFECFGASSAIITGVLAALFRSMIFYTAPIMKESLALFLLTCFVFTFMQAMRHGKQREFALSGFYLGLCALVRGNVLILAPAALALLWIRRRSLSASRTNAILFTFMIFVSIIPATLHNFLVSHDFVLINYDDGFNFYLGNSPWATGASYDFPPFINADPRPEEVVETSVARQATGESSMSPSAVSHYWRWQAITYIADHPAHTLFLLGNKLLAFWSADRQFDNYDVSFIEKHFSTLLSWPLISLWLITPLAIFAIIGLWGSRYSRDVSTLVILAVAYMCSVLMFYVTERYRLPMIIFILPLAGAAIPTAIKLIKQGNPQQLMLSLTGAFLALCLMMWPQPMNDLAAYDWGTLASIETDQGHYEKALDMIENGMIISPEKVGVDGMIKAAYAEEQLGRPEKAAQWLEQARQIYPHNGALFYNIGRLQAAQGHYTASLDSFREAIHLTPTYLLSYYGEAVVEEHLGDYDHAMASAQHGLDIDPTDTRLHEIAQEIASRIKKIP